MPRNVRNWWISANIEGRKSSLEGGPVSRDGGFVFMLKQRDSDKDVRPVVFMSGTVVDGRLILKVENRITRETWEIESKR